MLSLDKIPTFNDRMYMSIYIDYEQHVLFGISNVFEK